MKPFDRKYSRADLENCKLIRLKIATSGLDNPNGDFLIEEHACRVCEAGREIANTVKIPTNGMGKKRIDRNGRYGFIIMEKDIAEQLKDNGLRGFDSSAVIIGRDRSNFCLMTIQKTLPAMAQDSNIHKSEICPSCGRSGHYDNYETETRFKYHRSGVHNLTDDFFKTWECFGIWKMGQTHSEIVISQKCYRTLRGYKLQHLKFEPIDISQ